MASITTEANGRRTIQFCDANRKRKSVRIGKISMRHAETIRLRIESLIAASFANHSPDDETSRWLAGLPDDLHKKLVKSGLIQARAPSTLRAFIDEKIINRSGIKPRTKNLFELTRDSLVAYFGPDKPLREITKGDGEDWRAFLLDRGSKKGTPLGLNTVNDRCRKARRFFNRVMSFKLITENPFLGLPSTVKGNGDRLYFVSLDETQKVLGACPDIDWQLLVALCRFGGLRNPSETLNLRWKDVNWAQNRMTVQSPKTEHHEGKESRVVPLFPELRPYLEQARDQAEDGAEYVISRWRSQERNLRTQLHKIIRRAGLQPWPKTFQNMRSTRQTELEEEFPSHVVCAWIGNSESVARKHYLQLTEDHFARATAGDSALQNPVQQPAASGRTEPQLASADQKAVSATPVRCETLRKDAAQCESASRQRLHPSGLEPLTFGSVDRCSIQLS